MKTYYSKDLSVLPLAARNFNCVQAWVKREKYFAYATGAGGPYVDRLYNNLRQRKFK